MQEILIRRTVVVYYLGISKIFPQTYHKWTPLTCGIQKINLSLCGCVALSMFTAVLYLFKILQLAPLLFVKCPLDESYENRKQSCFFGLRPQKFSIAIRVIGRKCYH